MPWIESHTALARHPKVLRLARLLGLRVPAALGHLHLLWWWALEYAPSGDLSPFDADEIAIACMWEGETAGLLPALQQAGFLDQDGMLHDWYEYVGRLLEKRRKDVERVQQWREHQKRTPEGTSGERTPPATAAPLERNVDVTRNERVRSAAVHVTYNAPTVPTVPTVLHPPPPPAGAAPAPAREAAVVDTPATLPRVPKPVKMGAFIDAVQTADVAYTPSDADGRALKSTPLSALQVAEVYIAIARGDFGDDFLRDRLSARTAIGAWNGYETAQRAPPRVSPGGGVRSRSGRPKPSTARGPSAVLNALDWESTVVGRKEMTDGQTAQPIAADGDDADGRVIEARWRLSAAPG